MTSIFDKLLNDTKFRKKLQFTRTSHVQLQDCQIKCNNNHLLGCHRCILVARCEYFQSMLIGCWIESSQAVIDLPFDIDLMQIIVDYLYTDDIKMDFIHFSDNISASIKGKNERELEILFNVYVLSDQLLLDRLKNKCEFKLANLVNLKNVAEVYEFSDQYGAKQLKEFAMEFIVVNLTTLLEAKQLEALPLQLLKDLSCFYRSYFPLVASRIITPYSSGPQVDSIDLVPLEFLQDQSFIEASVEEETSVAKKKNFNSSRETFIKSEILRGLTSPVESIVKSELIEVKQKMDEVSEARKELLEKWEKVGKKNRRKISEKETNIHSISNLKQPPVTTPQTSNKSPPNSSSFSENLSLNSPKSLEKETKKSPSVESSSLTSEWPSLGDMIVKKKDPLPMETKKKLPKLKGNQQNKSSLTPTLGTTKPMVITTGPAWGGTGVSKENICSDSNSFSLLDVMNEEMKKLKVNETPKKTYVPKPAQVVPVKTGWDIPTSHSMNSIPICSIANIMEMETRSKDQYKKLKNRPLNIIQMEEAAIERLLKYYDVENVFDMTIKIELIDEVDFKDCAPIWNKKK